MPFVHLHTHSGYSFLRGLPSPAQLVQAAAAQGMPALALTDYGGLTGAIEFYDACLAGGIKPLLGLELPVSSPSNPVAAADRHGSLVLLALDLLGWRSLCRLSSAFNTSQEYSNSALPFETLAQHTDGLICLTGGKDGLAAHLLEDGGERAAGAWLSELKTLFSGRLYVELHHHSPQDDPLCAHFVSIARRARLPIVAANNIHMLDPREYSLARLLAAMRLNTTLNALSPGAAPPQGAHFRSSDEMLAAFSSYPEALAHTDEIAQRCQLELPLGKPHFPQVALPPGKSAAELLRQKAFEGARQLYGEITSVVETRLDNELSVIDNAGYGSLFLLMEEILKYARSIGVPHSSRGSAASSLVAHCLGITSPDPIGLNLYFERFLNPARVKPPDIDTDLCSRRRDEVIRYVYKRYGSDRVAMVCTINRFRRRSALRETAKAYGLPAGEVKELADALPHGYWGPPERFAPDETPFAGLVERYPSPVHQAIFADAGALLGNPRHLSVHPGGVVIAPVPLTDLAPLQLAPKGMVITQFDLESIERLGLVKIDLLGIRGLTVLGDVAELLSTQPSELTAPGEPEAGSSPERPALARKAASRSKALDVLESIPFEDPVTAEAVRSGRTIGCFQIESPGMRATLKEIQASSVDDIMAALALYRPGPLTGGLKDAFVRRYRGEEPVSHLHPALAPLLEDTYGVILYQEQVLRIAHELAGLSLADADLLRRAMSHFDPGKQMQALQSRFVGGVHARHGLPEALANRVWEMMAAFAGYGFPKAHAASYAVVAWRSAWCKHHFPEQFMAAVLANWGGYYSQRVYLTEARRMGLTLRPPHINYARREFSASYLEDQPVLFMGLDQVRDLTHRTQNRILQLRPFKSLADFLTRVDPRPVEAENLVKVGALEGFGSIPGLLHQISSGWRASQLSMFDLFDRHPGAADQDWTADEKAAAQHEILGLSVDLHPLELAADRVNEAGALSTIEAAAHLGKVVRVAGMRQTWRRSHTMHGEVVYFMALEDLEGMLEVIITGEVYRRWRNAFFDAGPFVVEGAINAHPESGEPYIRASRIEHL